jgi:hypothetical protein
LYFLVPCLLREISKALWLIPDIVGLFWEASEVFRLIVAANVLLLEVSEVVELFLAIVC